MTAFGGLLYTNRDSFCIPPDYITILLMQYQLAKAAGLTVRDNPVLVLKLILDSLSRDAYFYLMLTNISPVSQHKSCGYN